MDCTRLVRSLDYSGGQPLKPLYCRLLNTNGSSFEELVRQTVSKFVRTKNDQKQLNFGPDACLFPSLFIFFYNVNDSKARRESGQNFLALASSRFKSHLQDSPIANIQLSQRVGILQEA